MIGHSEAGCYGNSMGMVHSLDWHTAGRSHLGPPPVAMDPTPAHRAAPDVPVWGMGTRCC